MKRLCISHVPKSISLTWMLVPGSFASSGVIVAIGRDTTGSRESIVSGTNFSCFRASVALNDEMWILSSLRSVQESSSKIGYRRNELTSMDNFTLAMQKIQCQEALTCNLLDMTRRKSTTTKLIPQGQ